MQPQQRRSSSWRLLGSLLLLLVALLVFIFRQTILDEYAVRTYQPSAAIAAITSKAALSDKGKYYFYASRPQIEERQAFNDTCTQRGEKTAVLGCYAAMHIYIFNVTDERLAGIKEVTAAHEMLHAAYDRLSVSEKKRVTDLLTKQLEATTDERIKSLVALYDKEEPGERINELHSIFGTELDTLSPELETYYARYFTDRKSIVALAQQYESVFDQITAEQNALVAELNTLSSQISAESEQYNADTRQLNSDIDTFNAKANSGGFSSQAAFNTARQDLLRRQSNLQQARQALNAKIADYNEKRKALEELNGQADDLNRSINSQLSPVPSV